MEYSEIIAIKLKEIRLSRKMKQEDVARKSKVSRSSVSYYEKGRKISVEDLDSVCKALGVDMFYFLDECKREMEKYNK